MVQFYPIFEIEGLGMDYQNLRRMILIPQFVKEQLKEFLIIFQMRNTIK